jgi:hypothetical protein
MIFAVAFAMALYSASVLDLETVDCFCALHDIRFDPIKTANPPIDLLSSRHPAQSASENPLTTIDGDLVIRSPKSKVPLTYLRIRLTAVKCNVVGACRYCYTLFMEKAKSDHVRVRYYNPPTMLR